MFKQFIAVTNGGSRLIVNAGSVLVIMVLTILLNPSLPTYFLLMPYLTIFDINYAIQNNFSRKSIWQIALLWSVLQAGIVLILMLILQFIFHLQVNIMFYTVESSLDYIFIFILALFGFLTGITIQTLIYISKEKYGVYIATFIIYFVLVFAMLAFFWLANVFTVILSVLIAVEVIVLLKLFKSTDFTSRLNLKEQLRNK